MQKVGKNNNNLQPLLSYLVGRHWAGREVAAGCKRGAAEGRLLGVAAGGSQAEVGEGKPAQRGQPSALGVVVVGGKVLDLGRDLVDRELHKILLARNKQLL